ncbi:MAG: InlB B-repeat-containing protein, partial [Kiritimatiellae bacterium]|nr:InlB B-repeat-containing protein [Kiritimatiellia bacterium]
RGDVRSSGSNYGGFVGRLSSSSATIDGCWCSGAVWGTGGTIGAFVGNKSGTITNCAIYAYGAGPRPFCGSDSTFEGGSLSAARIEELTRDWPEVKQHVDGATPISTAEELLAVTNDLAGIYVLTADIDFEGAAIEPIGNESTAFSGEFYGQNYAIRNFVVDVTNRYVGLFGRIEGGRVSGVVAEGSVRGAYAGSGSSTGTGGFAGKIGSQSLVDGCSFEGGVTNATTYNAGGFVGWTDGSPVILRSSFTGRVVQQANGSADAGGFAGDHGGGYVMDCYAIADVEAGNNRYVGGFAGGAGGRIATSWCAASVESTGTYRGAFAGYAQTDYVTDCYYDSGKTNLPAVGNIASYDGISALATDDMLHEASFAGFDFVATWNIDEGESTPYLRSGGGEQIVEFDAGEGTCDPSSAVYEIGEHYGDLPVPVWAGHAFLGWFDAAQGGTQVTAESRVTSRPARMLYARWTDRQTVSFDPNGAPDPVDDLTFAIGGKYRTLPKPEWAPNVFLGWFTAAEGGNLVQNPDVVTEEAVRTLYAHWADSQIVTFDARGGTSAENTMRFPCGGKYAGLPEAEREGYTFLGWFNAEEGGNRVTENHPVTATAARTLFAHWVEAVGPGQQRVAFDANGGTCVLASKVFDIGGKYAGLPVPEKAGFVFLGWFNAAEGGSRVTENHTVTATAVRTLHAQWADHQTVAFDAQGGTCATETMAFGFGGKYADLPEA